MDIERIEQLLERISTERDWNQFHSPKNLSMALSVEASELLEIFQWLTEKESENLSTEKKGMVKDEIADIAIYLIRICMKLNINLEDSILTKIDKFEKKYPISKSRGNAKKYTEF